MSSRNGICFAEAHKSCHVLPNSIAHGPTSLPSILRVAIGGSSFIEIFSTVFLLRCYKANGLPKGGEFDSDLKIVENKCFIGELPLPLTVRIEMSDDG